MNVGRQCNSGVAAMAMSIAAGGHRARCLPLVQRSVVVGVVGVVGGGDGDGGATNRAVARALGQSSSSSLSGARQRRSICGRRENPAQWSPQPSAAVDINRGVAVAVAGRRRSEHYENQSCRQCWRPRSQTLVSPEFSQRREFAASTTTEGTGLEESSEPGGFVSSDARTSAASAAPVKVSMDELMVLASRQPNALSLADMYCYASMPTVAPSTNKNVDPSQFVDVNRLRNAQFLHKEMTIRLAQRAVDLLTLPHGLNRTREVQSIANTYLQYLQRIRDFPPPTNPETERRFTEMLSDFVLDRHSIPAAISQALQSLKDERKAPVDARRQAEMEAALYRFFTARVGLRFLTEHHILTSDGINSDELYRRKLEKEGNLELFEREEPITADYASSRGDGVGETKFSGCIQRNCDAVKEVRRTAARVTKLCRESYGLAPEIEIVSCTSGRDEDGGAPFTYVPHHLRYILAEVLKNSCRATVQSYLKGTAGQKEDHTKHHDDPDGGIHDAPTLPPIKVVVAQGAEDVTIKIADRAGGMPRSAAKRIWTFAHSTLSEEGRSREDARGDFGQDEFMGGRIRGFGLPLARIYARYFGGEVTIKSMEGYGVDAYLYLPVLGVACENLPHRVIRSPGNLDSSAQAEDDDTGDGADGDGHQEGVDDDGYTTEGYSRNDDFFEQGTAVGSRRTSVIEKLDERAL